MVYMMQDMMNGKDARQTRKERERAQGYERYYESEYEIDRQVASKEIISAGVKYMSAAIGWCGVAVVFSQAEVEEKLSLWIAPFLCLILMLL